MEELKRAHFECIKEDNSDEEDEKQWKHSKIIFEKFNEYLKNKGLKETTADNRTGKVEFFVMDYLFVYDDAMSILEVYDDTIRRFLGNWYIRKFMDPKISSIKSYLKAISNFFEFIYKEGFITKEHLMAIKEVCKDKEWFDMRLKTYFEADGEEFHEWIEEYNYDFF